ncbi:MAG: HU family DNA-binding protein [Muribaculaceae bacterium]|nr:HU family DNA-binding protein [Muribaculaceae bacterium]
MDNKTLIESIASRTRLDKTRVQEIISSFCGVLADSCLEMDTVIIPGFGQFEARKRKERLTVHPASGQRLMVPPKLVINFKPSGVLKSKI